MLTELEQRANTDLAESLGAFVRESAARTVAIGEYERLRSAKLEPFGIRTFYALHLASAESGGADVFLTMDVRLVRAAMRATPKIAMPAMNAVQWLEGMAYGRESLDGR